MAMKQNDTSLSYPSTDTVLKNARMLAPVASARIGEMKSISDFIYYSLIFQDMAPWAASLFEKLALTEMRHYQLLGRLSLCLGGNPVLRVRLSDTPLPSPPEPLVFCLKKALTEALSAERAAYRHYAKMKADFAYDPAAEALLERIALDEEHHIRMLTHALSEWAESEAEDAPSSD